MDTKDIEHIIHAHNGYWEKLKPQMRNYMDAYSLDMFRSKTEKHGTYMETSDQVIINTPDGNSHIEGYMGSLYPKAPAVNVGPDATNQGAPEVVEKIINRFLYDQGQVIQNGIRNALIFPNAFFKLGHKEKKRAVDSIVMRALNPWDVILDLDANDWADQRWVGHRYFISVFEAKKKWGNKKFSGGKSVDYLRDDDPVDGKSPGLSDLLGHIEIYEIYSLLEDKLIFYCPSLTRDDKILDECKIPFRSYDEQPIAPIAPLYFSTEPSSSLRGISQMKLIYDAIYEKNALRTRQANAVRQDTRQYLVRKNVLDENSKSRLQENVDNSIIEVIVPDNMSIDSLIVPVRSLPLSQDYSIYKNDIQSDIDKGTVTAPFTRGIATNATATEVAVLTQYSASQIGKFARTRDACIELISQIYISILSTILEAREETEEIEQIIIDGSPITIVSKDLKGKFKFSAQDQGSTPVSRAIKKQEFISVIPILSSLGVDTKELLKKAIIELDLPDSFLKENTAIQNNIMSDTQADIPQEIQVGGGQIASDIRSV